MTGTIDPQTPIAEIVHAGTPTITKNPTSGERAAVPSPPVVMASADVV